MDAVVNAVMMLIVRDYSSPTDIPPHSRWRHFEAASAAMKLAKCDRINPLLESWKKEMSSKGRSDTTDTTDTTTTTTAADEREPVRRLVDLFVVSVLLDAGAGSRWSFHPQSEQTGESERTKQPAAITGARLALASLEWFMAGGLSSDTDTSPACRCHWLAAVTHESLSAAFQVNQHSNPLVEEGRALAAILAARSSGSSTESTTESTTVSEADALGLVPFHKLSQWLTYSLMEPLSLLGVSFAGADLLTGLAEYRNGGLFVDMGVISLRDSSIHMRSQGPESVPRFNVFDDAVVEWRALTVGLLDMVAAVSAAPEPVQRPAATRKGPRGW
ncbi:hypothetical protein BSLG_003083 [Batrachochytrium salamandrivorans]|nr:hypothetical protein BSLG_003083 [Batrachochytrium salamandrivorans]